MIFQRATFKNTERSIARYEANSYSYTVYCFHNMSVASAIAGCVSWLLL